MIEPAVTCDRHTIFWACGPVSITEAMELTSPSGAPIMQAIIDSAGEVTEDVFGSCEETWGRASEVLREALYGMSNVWVSADRQVE